MCSGTRQLLSSIESRFSLPALSPSQVTNVDKDMDEKARVETNDSFCSSWAKLLSGSELSKGFHFKFPFILVRTINCFLK